MYVILIIKVGSVIDGDFSVLKIGKIVQYVCLYTWLSTLCIMYSDMMSWYYENRKMKSLFKKIFNGEKFEFLNFLKN